MNEDKLVELIKLKIAEVLMYSSIVYCSADYIFLHNIPGHFMLFRNYMDFHDKKPLLIDGCGDLVPLME